MFKRKQGFFKTSKKPKEDTSPNKTAQELIDETLKQMRDTMSGPRPLHSSQIVAKQRNIKHSQNPTEDTRMEEVQKLMDEALNEVRDAMNGYPSRSS